MAKLPFEPTINPRSRAVRFPQNVFGISHVSPCPGGNRQKRI
jgi:hypothetical protein